VKHTDQGSWARPRFRCTRAIAAQMFPSPPVDAISGWRLERTRRAGKRNSIQKKSEKNLGQAAHPDATQIPGASRELPHQPPAARTAGAAAGSSVSGRRRVRSFSLPSNQAQREGGQRQGKVNRPSPSPDRERSPPPMLRCRPWRRCFFCFCSPCGRSLPC
jgi:hypothetical protein